MFSIGSGYSGILDSLKCAYSLRHNAGSARLCMSIRTGLPQQTQHSIWHQANSPATSSVSDALLKGGGEGKRRLNRRVLRCSQLRAGGRGQRWLRGKPAQRHAPPTTEADVCTHMHNCEHCSLEVGNRLVKEANLRCSPGVGLLRIYIPGVEASGIWTAVDGQ